MCREGKKNNSLKEITKKVKSVKDVPRFCAEAFVLFYRRCISPLTPPSCRFTPTCSEYSMQALNKYGFLKGSWLTIKRILRCHPFSKGGYDPLP